MLLGELNDLVDVAEGKPRDRVSTSVVDGDTTCLCIMQRSAGEGYVGHVSQALVLLARGDEVRARAELYLPRLIEVKQGGAKGIDEAVARSEDAMVD